MQWGLLVTVFLLWIGTLPLSAASVFEETEEPAYPYGELWELLPDESRALLPDGLSDSQYSEDVLQKIDGAYLWSLCLNLLKNGLSGGLALFATLLGLIVVAAAFRRFSDLFFTDKSPILEYALMLIAALQIYTSVYTLFAMTREVVGTVNQYMNALIAALSALFLLTGNGSVAATASAWMGLLLTVTEKLCYGLFFPLLQISFGGTLMTSACPELNLRPILGFLRRICTTVLILFMTVITLILSYQTAIAASADSLGMRGIKFAAANLIPIIGGLFSDTLRTLGGTFSLVRTTVGLVGVLGLLVCLLVPLSALFCAKYSLSLAGTAAEILDVPTVKPLLEESEKLIGFLIALLLLFGLFYLILLGVLISTASAVGG